MKVRESIGVDPRATDLLEQVPQVAIDALIEWAQDESKGHAIIVELKFEVGDAMRVYVADRRGAVEALIDPLGQAAAAQFHPFPLA